jgi:hypothetical protein
MRQNVPAAGFPPFGVEQKFLRADFWLSADGIEDVGGHYHVQHFLHYNRMDDVRRLVISPSPNGVKSA